jgi:hypothetical protein
MGRIARWIGLRDGILIVLATAIGFAIGYVDSQPTWDDTGITLSLLLLTSAMVAGLSGRRPLLWALLIGGWIPIFEIGGAAGPASLIGLAVAVGGALAGWALIQVAASGRS